MKRRKSLLLSCLIVSFIAISCVGEKSEESSVLSLEKVDEFEMNMAKSGVTIGKIDSYCLDSENNIYIADSGFNKIHKFDSDGNYLRSYGREGQGPGEFMANPHSERLRISYGNDANIYVYDTGNNRLSIFSGDFEFIKGFSMPYTARVIDSPAVSSQGEIFFVARIENKLVHKFDNDMNLITSFLDDEDHFQFPFYKPSSVIPFTGEFDLRKAMNSKDQLVAVSNYSLNVYIFDVGGKMINKFAVDNRHFRKDFGKQIDLMKKDEKKKQGIILPFYLFIDNTDGILLAYFSKQIDNYEVYRYTANGILQKVLRFPEKVAMPFQCDGQGNIYAKHSGSGEESLRKYRLLLKREG